MESRRSFGTTISVSTSPESSSIPFSACLARRVPSKPNGLVTMPTVSAPTSRAMRATTGAAPVPVPPPAPAVMKTMSLPLSTRLIASCSANAARAAQLGVGAGAEAAGHPAADVELDVSGALLERLHVGVDRDELDAAHAGLDHAVDGVDAGASDADDADDGIVDDRRCGGEATRLRAAVGGLGLSLVAAEGIAEAVLRRTR